MQQHARPTCAKYYGMVPAGAATAERLTSAIRTVLLPMHPHGLRRRDRQGRTHTKTTAAATGTAFAFAIFFDQTLTERRTSGRTSAASVPSVAQPELIHRHH